MADNNYIWVFGENKAETACENPFHFWKYCLEQNDNIDGYLVLKRNAHTQEVYDGLTKTQREHVLWYDSKKHRKMYQEADMFFVSYSYNDICPTKLRHVKRLLDPSKATVFLQKDTSTYFKPVLTGESQNNNIFRYCVYDESIYDKLKDINNFRDYQLTKVKYPLKFSSDLFKRQSHDNVISWFVEWRYYSSSREVIVENLKDILKSKRLIDYLNANNLKLKVFLHSYYKKSNFKDIYDLSNDSIEVINSRVISQDDLINSRLLITDYSSYAYDFSLFKKPVILYQPDFDIVKSKHQFYGDADEIASNSISSAEELIDDIINENYEMNPVFDIWTDQPSDDSHIKELYDYFLEKQINKITFIGYNFFGAGGTVSSTKALAEGLMQQDYLVELYSILRTNSNNSRPNGINFSYGFYRNTISFTDKFTYLRHRFKRNFGYLKYEFNTEGIHPYSGYHLRKTLKNIRSNTVVSTRETLHLFLEECESDFIKNKIYFFHAPADTLDVMYPGLIHDLEKKTLNKTIFVTESNRQALKELFGYDNYNEFTVIGNALEQVKVIDRDEITAIEPKKKYMGLYLLRVSTDRKDDLNNLFEFAKYLKSNNITNIIIDVFGSGDYFEGYMDKVNDAKLDNIIKLRGRTNDPAYEIRNHDFMSDFTLNHSFGMIYIEGVLNGAKVFCMKNAGSTEVMEGIDNSYIESYQWLVDQIEGISDITLEELQKNYDIHMSRFSQEAVSRKFLDFLD